MVLAGVAFIMTVGVYGLVAGIVKIDDLGLYLTRRPSATPEGGFTQALGRGLLRAAPVLMKVLSVAGTAAMFLVGGGILVHGLPFCTTCWMVCRWALCGTVWSASWPAPWCWQV